MNEPHPEAKSIFGQALAIATAEARAAYLERACGGDVALRAEVESLLAALEKLGLVEKVATPAPVFIPYFDEARLHDYLRLAAALRAALSTSRSEASGRP